MENTTTNFQTEQEKKYNEQTRKIVLSTCVSCEQQLRLLQLRLISFEDLITGVTETIKGVNKELTQLEKTKPIKTEIPKLKKV